MTMYFSERKWWGRAVLQPRHRHRVNGIFWQYSCWLNDKIQAFSIIHYSLFIILSPAYLAI